MSVGTRRWVWAGAAALGFVALTLADHALVGLLHDEAWHARAEITDGYRLLRVAGYIPTWLLIALCLFLADLRAMRRGAVLEAPEGESPRSLNAPDRAVMLTGAVVLAGLAAEVLKATLQRHRPGGGSGYVWQWASDAAAPASYGLPSSHAAVAFAGAFMLGRLIPAAWWPLVLWAAGCAWTRLASGRHFSTDVYAAAVLSYAVCAGLWWARSRAGSGGARRVGPIRGARGQGAP